uniref:Uncharacterized protein n=1 Tax=Glossina pallidipes TaxID=7398 RepID=A0A1A9ZV24_GLOPL
MTYIPNETFADALQMYPDFWELGGRYVRWEVSGTELAYVLSQTTNSRITLDDVKIKWGKIRSSLKRLNTAEGTSYKKLRPYMWWAQKLNLTRAVEKMSIKMARKRPSRTPRVVPEELKGVPPREVIDINEDFSRFAEKDEGPSTSSAPAQGERNQRPLQAEQIPQEDFVVGVEALREVVNKLTPQDKIVLLTFDGVFTNGEAKYSRAKDVLYICGYRLSKRSKTKFVSEPYRTILVFGVRSIPKENRNYCEKYKNRRGGRVRCQSGGLRQRLPKSQDGGQFHWRKIDHKKS